jgi:hypothetical protein
MVTEGAARQEGACHAFRVDGGALCHVPWSQCSVAVEGGGGDVKPRGSRYVQGAAPRLCGMRHANMLWRGACHRDMYRAPACRAGAAGDSRLQRCAL